MNSSFPEFLSFLVIALFEMICLGTWFAPVFRFSVPVYRRTYLRKRTTTLSPHDLDRQFSTGRFIPLVFRKTEDNEYLFREAMFYFRFFTISYSPIMRGQLLFDSGSVTVIGRLNWYFVAFGGLVLWMLLQFEGLGGLARPGAFSIIIFTAIGLACFLIQAHRYRKVGEYFAEAA